MRESIGGTWLLSIVVVFIALFSAFLAYSIRYTKAFNVKSEIINLIERNEGWTSSSNDVLNITDEQRATDKSVELQAYDKIKSFGYDINAANGVDCSRVDGHNQNTIQTAGICITKYCPDKIVTETNDEGEPIGFDGANKRTYYKVTTFIAFELPVFDFVISIPVTGETRTLYMDAGDIDASKCVVPSTLE